MGSEAGTAAAIRGGTGSVEDGRVLEILSATGVGLASMRLRVLTGLVGVAAGSALMAGKGIAGSGPGVLTSLDKGEGGSGRREVPVCGFAFLSISGDRTGC